MQQLVIVGGGQAGAQIADVARHQGFGGPIHLITEEEPLPYQRPPLSKHFLLGTKPERWLLYREAEFYEKKQITVMRAARAVRIDRQRQHLQLDNGTSIPYDHLALATGTRARTLSVRGAELEQIFYIRTIADVQRLRAQLPAAQRIVVVGGGFIGLEAAAMMTQLGKQVVLLAAAERLIPRVAPLDISRLLSDEHTRHGVAVALNSTVAEIRRNTQGSLDVCATEGRIYPADLVLVGIGAVPVTELAAQAGLTCENGVCVDELARTSDPNILAAGDCTNHYNPLLQRRLRLETVHNAVEQGRTAGHSAAGQAVPYAQIPWVWSDQYNFRLQFVGVIEHHDRTVLRGDPASGRFSLFLYRQDSLIGVACVNQSATFAAGRRILNSGIGLSPQEAADAKLDLAAVAATRPSLGFASPWALEANRATSLAWGHS